MTKRVKYIYLDREYETFKLELDSCFNSIMSQGLFILREDVERFEQAVCERLNTKHCIGVNSGTDALRLSISALSLPKGSKVICPAHCFISAVNALLEFNLVPSFVDINEEDHNINFARIKETCDDQTSAILVVHMNGIPAQMEEIVNFAKEKSLKVIEDSAQAFDSSLNGRSCGTFGDIGTLSMHPLKTLNAAGDAGAVITHSEQLAERVRALRNIGPRCKGKYDSFGYNSRLDNLQAKILLQKLKHFDEMIIRRKNHSNNYREFFKKYDLSIPRPLNNTDQYRCTFSNFVIVTSRAESVRQNFENHNIEYLRAWFPPVYKANHLKKYNYMRKKFSVTDYIAENSINLPIHPLMTDNEREIVSCLVQRALEKPIFS